MKCVIFLFFAILASIDCRPQPQFGFDALTRTASRVLTTVPQVLSSVPQILKYNAENFINGFSFDVDTSDGFHHDARGEVISDTGRVEDEGLEVQGSYMYTGDDGQLYRVDYTAGKEGFRPAGAHLVPSAGVRKLGVGDGASASLAGTGLG